MKMKPCGHVNCTFHLGDESAIKYNLEKCKCSLTWCIICKPPPEKKEERPQYLELNDKPNTTKEKS